MSTTPTPPAPVSNWTKFSVGLSLLAFAMSAVTGSIAYQQWTISAEQLAMNKIKEEREKFKEERATGRVKAKFEFARTDMYEPAVLKSFIRKKEGFDEWVFRLDKLDDLLRWGPSVAVKNTGTEVIDGIRLEIHLVGGRAYGKGVEQKQPPPIIVTELDVAETTSFGKLMPQNTAKITITPTLLQQMMHSRVSFYPDNDHESYYFAQVACRIVGGSTYDRMEPENFVKLNFDWKPTGFKDDTRLPDVLKMPLKVDLN